MNMTTEIAIQQELGKIFQTQKENQYNIGNNSARERIAKLKKLKHAIEVDFRDAIREALYMDFKKTKAEVDLTEIYPITSEIKHTIAHLSRWMQPQTVDTPLALIGSSSWIQYEPKGVCLIISPWNFPINLTFAPLVSAIAAGNTVIIKPSENTPHSSAVMKKIIESLFDKNEIALVEGGIDTSTALLDLPFNHIFFTGAPSIGKVVMAAAAKHLASVTLELGGKSPTIVDETADIEVAARRITWGKFTNAGQICIAPDYIFVHESKKEQLIKSIDNQLVSYFGNDEKPSPHYAQIVNERHLDRIKSYIDDAVLKGANILRGGKSERAEKYIAPTLIENVAMDSALMQNEIFGPVLPIFTYKNIEEPLRYIQNNEIPLALYIYSKNRRNVRHILQNTRAGGTCINNNDIHFSNNNLPFGGSNNSGIGKGHGKFGFEAFSNARGVYKQHLPSILELLVPPYTAWKERLIEWAVKWF
jgi:aldehyde dehydrogenase (NAD+)